MENLAGATYFLKFLDCEKKFPFQQKTVRPFWNKFFFFPVIVINQRIFENKLTAPFIDARNA